jgi:acyl-CoA synthetase (AMP-forming)/AMP-acid ligase II
MASLAQRLASRSEGSDIAIGPHNRVVQTEVKVSSKANSDVVGLCITDPISFVNTLIHLDGSVAQLVLLSHALPPQTVSVLLESAGCTRLVTDRTDLGAPFEQITPEAAIAKSVPAGSVTKWTLTTSGTTGLPKLIPHTLNSLTHTVARGNPAAAPRWGLLYDPTRFAGLQVVLQALIGGGVLLTPDTHAPLAEQIATLKAQGCTHLSATPTLWRRLLMAPGFSDLALKQITLGGEIVDQQVLDTLNAAHPSARITHIYASTEAGVGFAVTDGQAGFPTHFLQDIASIRMKIVDEVLWLRPPAGAQRPLECTEVETDQEGYIRSGDLIQIKDGRGYFLGRDNGTINVCGVKIHPEMVEQTIMSVAGVKLAKISAKKSPISGALVVAEVMIDDNVDTKTLKAAIKTHCKATLEREAVPTIIHFVDTLVLNAAGKLIRTNDAK